MPQETDQAPREQARESFEQLRLCATLFQSRFPNPVHLWSRICQGAVSTRLQSSQQALLDEIAQAVALHRRDQALDLLDALAGVDPDHALFGDVDAPADETTPEPLATCRRALRGLCRDPQWIASSGQDDLRAVLGLDLFQTGRPGPGLALLDGVRWKHISFPDYFLQKITAWYWTGGARVVGNFVRELAPIYLEPGRFNKSARILAGVFTAYSDQREIAHAILRPLLPEVLHLPELLFQVIDGLMYVRHDDELRAFFRQPGVLAGLEAGLDREQRQRLAALLFNAGLEDLAGRSFEVLAREQPRENLVELPVAVHALVMTGRGELAEALTAKALDETCGSRGVATAVPVAECLIHLGRIEQAKNVLAAVSPQTVEAPRQAAELFWLYERLGLYAPMRTVWPLLGEVTPGTLGHFFWMRFYEGRLSEGLAFVGERSWTRFCPGFPIQTAFLFWLGRFDEARTHLDDPAFAGDGPVALGRHYWNAQLAIVAGEPEVAQDAYDTYFFLMDRYALNLGNRCLMAPLRFERLLHLRSLGRLDEALAEAASHVRRFDLEANPCRPLAALLARERGTPTCDQAEEARQSERAADLLCNPRSYCQGWLYLHAAMLRAGLGQREAAEAIVRRKLSGVLFLHPDGRKALKNFSWAELPAWRDRIQSFFFPHLHGTFWNHTLDSVLQQARTPLCPGGE